MTLHRFRLLSAATAASVYFLIVLGAYVTATGSGRACPDWPLCYGQIIPPLRSNILIEWTHRLWTVVATLMIIVTSVQSWRLPALPLEVRRFAVLSVFSIVGQIFLGMETVVGGSTPVLVTAHQAAAMIVFASTVATATFAFSSRKVPTVTSFASTHQVNNP